MFLHNFFILILSLISFSSRSVSRSSDSFWQNTYRAIGFSLMACVDCSRQNWWAILIWCLLDCNWHVIRVLIVYVYMLNWRLFALLGTLFLHENVYGYSSWLRSSLLLSEPRQGLQFHEIGCFFIIVVVIVVAVTSRRLISVIVLSTWNVHVVNVTTGLLDWIT